MLKCHWLQFKTLAFSQQSRSGASLPKYSHCCFFPLAACYLLHAMTATRGNDPKDPHSGCQELNLRKDKLEMEFTNVVAQNIVATIPNRQQSTGQGQGPLPWPNSHSSWVPREQLCVWSFSSCLFSHAASVTLCLQPPAKTAILLDLQRWTQRVEPKNLTGVFFTHLEEAVVPFVTSQRVPARTVLRSK